MPADVHGILLFDKPVGLSSAGAVARVKRLFDARKAGHTGSLDPLASGLLPICFGEATKFSAQLLDADKTYRVTARLGERTPSADRESEVVERRELPAYSAPQLAAALNEFPREDAQVPPMHSALKQDGKPLYEYARAGITRERDRKSTRLNSSHVRISYPVFCLKKTRPDKLPAALLVMIFAGWISTVRGLMPRSKAICLLARPSSFFNDTAPSGFYTLSLLYSLPV